MKVIQVFNNVIEYLNKKSTKYFAVEILFCFAMAATFFAFGFFESFFSFGH